MSIKCRHKKLRGKNLNRARLKTAKNIVKAVVVALMLVVCTVDIKAQAIACNQNGTFRDRSNELNPVLTHVLQCVYDDAGYTLTWNIDVDIADSTPFRLFVLWGDGTQTMLMGNTAQLPRTGAALAGALQGQVSSRYQITITHTYPAGVYPPICGYFVQNLILFEANRTSGQAQNSTAGSCSGALRSITQWAREDRGGEMRLWNNRQTINANGGVIPNNQFWACQGYPVNAQFIDRSILACNIPSTEFNPNSLRRQIQYVYGTAGNITNVLNPRGITPAEWNNATQSWEVQDIVGLVPGDNVIRGVQPTQRIYHDQNARYVDKYVHGPPTTAGQSYRVLLRNWNACNEMPQSPSTTTADVIIRPLPVPPNPTTWEWCHRDHYQSDQNMTINVSNSSYMQPNPANGYPYGGTYRWYNVLADNTINRDRRFTNPNTFDWGISRTPNPIHTGASFNPVGMTTRDAQTGQVVTVARNRPGIYDFYVTYEASYGITCESQPIRMRWVIRENIYAAPVKGSITFSGGTRNSVTATPPAGETTPRPMGNGNVTDHNQNIVVCDGEVFELHLARQAIDNRANTPIGATILGTGGGDTEYVWEQVDGSGNPISSTTTGVTITRQGSRASDDLGQSVTVRVNRQQAANSGSYQVNIRVYRRFFDQIGAGNPSSGNVQDGLIPSGGGLQYCYCCEPAVFGGSTRPACNQRWVGCQGNTCYSACIAGTCRLCPSNYTTYTIIINPLPSGSLTGNWEICGNESTYLPITNIRGRTSSTLTVQFANSADGAQNNLTAVPNNTTYNTNSTASRQVNPPAGTITNYSIERITDNTTGCFSVYNPSAGNGTTGSFQRPAATYSRITNWYTVRKRAVIPAPNITVPRYLCVDRQYSWTTSVAALNMSGRASALSVPANTSASENRARQNVWRSTNQDGSTTVGTNPFVSPITLTYAGWGTSTTEQHAMNRSTHQGWLGTTYTRTTISDATLRTRNSSWWQGLTAQVFVRNEYTTTTSTNSLCPVSTTTTHTVVPEPRVSGITSSITICNGVVEAGTSPIHPSLDPNNNAAPFVNQPANVAISVQGFMNCNWFVNWTLRKTGSTHTETRTTEITGVSNGQTTHTINLHNIDPTGNIFDLFGGSVNAATGVNPQRSGTYTLTINWIEQRPCSDPTDNCRRTVPGRTTTIVIRDNIEVRLVAPDFSVCDNTNTDPIPIQFVTSPNAGANTGTFNFTYRTSRMDSDDYTIVTGRTSTAPNNTFVIPTSQINPGGQFTNVNLLTVQQTVNNLACPGRAVSDFRLYSISPTYPGADDATCASVITLNAAAPPAAETGRWEIYDPTYGCVNNPPGYAGTWRDCRWRPFTGTIYGVTISNMNARNATVSVTPGEYGTRELRWVTALTANPDWSAGARCANPINVSFGTAPDDGIIFPPVYDCGLSVTLEGVSSGMRNGVVQDGLSGQPNINGPVRRWETGVWALVSYEHPTGQETLSAPYNTQAGRVTHIFDAITGQSIPLLDAPIPAPPYIAPDDTQYPRPGDVSATGWLQLIERRTLDNHQLRFRVNQPGTYTFAWFIKSPCDYPTWNASSNLITVEVLGYPTLPTMADRTLCPNISDEQAKDNNIAEHRFVFTDDNYWKGSANPPDIDYHWTSDPGEVLGSGNELPDIPFFIGTDANMGTLTTTPSTPNERTITVTPSYRGCVGDPVSFKIFVKPQPVLSNHNVPPLCDKDMFETWLANRPIQNNAGATREVVYTWSSVELNDDNEPIPGSTHPNPGMTFVAPGQTWTSAIGGAGVRNGLELFADGNTTRYPLPDRGIITVVATVDGCPSEPQEYNVTVNPTAQIHFSDAMIEYCSNERINARNTPPNSEGVPTFDDEHIEFWSEVPNVTYTWRASGGNIGITPMPTPTNSSLPTVRVTEDASPVRQYESYVISPFTTADNQLSTNVIATITVTANAQSCISSETYQIEVKPRPIIRVAAPNNSVPDQAVCASMVDPFYETPLVVLNSFQTILPVIQNISSALPPPDLIFNWAHTGGYETETFDPSVQQAPHTVAPSFPPQAGAQKTVLADGSFEMIISVVNPDNTEWSGWHDIQAPSTPKTGKNLESVISVTPFMDGCYGRPETITLTSLLRPQLTGFGTAPADTLTFNQLWSEELCSRNPFSEKIFTVNTDFEEHQERYNANLSVRYSWEIVNTTPPFSSGVGVINPTMGAVNARWFNAADNTSGYDVVDIVRVQATSVLPARFVTLAGVAGCASPIDTFSYRVFPAPVIDPVTPITEHPFVNGAFEFCKDDAVNFENFTSLNVDEGKGQGNPSYWVRYIWEVDDPTIGVDLNKYPKDATNNDITEFPVDAQGNYITSPPPGVLKMDDFIGWNHMGDNTMANSNMKIRSDVTVKALTSDGCPNLVPPAHTFTLALKPNPQMLPIADMRHCDGVVTLLVQLRNNVHSSVQGSDDATAARWFINDIGDRNNNISAHRPASLPGELPALSAIEMLPAPDVEQSGFLGQFLTNYIHSHTHTDPDVYAQITTWAEVAGCIGDPIDFKIYIKPTPDILIPDDMLVCIGEQFAAIYPTSPSFPVNSDGDAGKHNPVADAFEHVSYHWRQTPPTLGAGMLSGTEFIRPFTVTNHSPQQFTPEVTTFTLYSELEFCRSESQSFTVTVLPRAQMDIYQHIVVCAGDPFVPEPFKIINPEVDGYDFEYKFYWEHYAAIEYGSPKIAPPTEWKIIETEGINAWQKPTPTPPYFWPRPNPSTTIVPGPPPTTVVVPNVNQQPYVTLPEHNYTTIGDFPEDAGDYGRHPGAYPPLLPGTNMTYANWDAIPVGHLPAFVGDTTRVDKNLPPETWGPTWGIEPVISHLRITPQVALKYPVGHPLEGDVKVCFGTQQPNRSITIKPLPKTIFDPSMNLCVEEGGASLYELIDVDYIHPASYFEWGWETISGDAYAPIIPTKEGNPAQAPPYQFAGAKGYEIYTYPNPYGVWEGYITVQQAFNGCYAPTEKHRIKTIPSPVVLLSFEPIPDSGVVVDRIHMCSGETVQIFGSIDGMNIIPWDYEYSVILDYENTEGVRLSTRGELSPWATFNSTPEIGSEMISLRAVKGGCMSNTAVISASVYELPQSLVPISANYCADEAEWIMALGRAPEYDVKWYRIDDMNIMHEIGNLDDRADMVVTNKLAPGTGLEHPNSLPDALLVGDEIVINEKSTFRYAAIQTNLINVPSRVLPCSSELVVSEMTILEQAIPPSIPDLSMLSYCHDAWDPRYRIFIIPDPSPLALGTTYHWFVKDDENDFEQPLGYARVGTGLDYVAWHNSPSEPRTGLTPGEQRDYIDYEPIETYFVQGISVDGCTTRDLVEVPLRIFPPPKLDIELEINLGGTFVPMPLAGGCSPLNLYATNRAEAVHSDYLWTPRPGETPIPAQWQVRESEPFRYVTAGTTPEGVVLRLTGTYNNTTVFRNPNDGDFCTNYMDTMVVVQPKVQAEFIATIQEGCEPLTVNFIARGLTQGAFNFRYYWNYTGNLHENNPPPHPDHWRELPQWNRPIETPSTDPDNTYFGISGLPDPRHVFYHSGDPSQPREYLVWMQADNGACFDNDSLVITVFPVPKSDFEILDLIGGSVCPPDAVKFNNLSAIGSDKNSANTLYTWSFGDGTMQDIPYNEPVEHYYENWVFPSPVQRTVTLNASNEFPVVRPGGIVESVMCNNTLSRTLFVNPQVQAAFTGDEYACSPASVRFVNQSFGAITSHNWVFPDGQISSAVNPTYNTVNDGARDVPNYGQVTLTVRNNWCADAVSHPFILLPQPIASFTIPPEQMQGCQPLDVTFYNTSNLNPFPNPPMGPDTEVSYTYDFGDGVMVVKNDTEEITHTYINTREVALPRNPSMTTSVTWNQYGLTCTSLPHRGEIYINPFIRAEFVPMYDESRCSPLTVTFRNASVGDDWFTYDFGNGHSHQGNREVPLIVQHTFTTDNMYEDMDFKIVLTAHTGPCSDTYEYDLNVRSTPTAAFRPGAPYPSDFRWPAEPINIENQIMAPDRELINTGHGGYLWTLTEEGSSYPNNFSRLVNPNPLTISEWGRYRITQRATAPNGVCTNSTYVQFRINPPLPIARFDDTDPHCAPATITFVNQSDYAVSQLWDFGDGFSSNQINPTHTFSDPGIYEVTLNVIGHDGDLDKMTKIVEVHPTPLANFRVAPNYLYVGQEARTYNFTTNTMPDGVTTYPIWYEWDWGDDTPIDTIRSPRHWYMMSGIYDVTLTVGTFTNPVCSDTLKLYDEVQLENYGHIIFPNIFRPSTPDRIMGGGGDGAIFGGEPSDIIPERGGYRNYLFFPAYMSPVAKYSLVIYSRQGIKLYETTDPRRGWNGYYRGRICEEGVYVWKAEGYFQTGQPFSVSGDVTLVR